MIIFLHGLDTYRSRQQLKKMVTKFKTDRDPQGLNVVKLNVDQNEPGQVLQEILAMPFLAERKMIVLENLLISKHKDLQLDLIERIKNKKLPEENVIIFWEGTDKFKNKVNKELAGLLEKEKFSQKFDELKGIQLSQWVKQELEEKGGKIESQALRYLVDNANGDMWGLSHLVEQLCAYKMGSCDFCAENSEPPPASGHLPLKGGGNTVELKDVQQFLGETADDNIFNLVDAIVGRQPKKVFKMIRQQYKKGEDAQFIFAMLIRQFKILLQLRDLFEREDNPNSGELAKRLGLHPFVVKKSLPLVRRYTMNELKQIYNKLLQMDIQTKTGLGDQSLLLDILVGGLV